MNSKGEKNGHHGYSIAKIYPSPELRNQLVAAGLPRWKHNLAELGEALLDLRNEFAQGYNDSGCFWHFQAGDRGSGAMIEGFGKTFSALDEDTEADARAKMWLHLKKEGLL